MTLLNSITVRDVLIAVSFLIAGGIAGGLLIAICAAAARADEQSAELERRARRQTERRPYYDYLLPSDKPVIEGLEAHQVTFAKDQPEYLPLPALVSNTRDRRVMSRWTLTDAQREAIVAGADLYLTLSTFGGLLQPVTLAVGDQPNPDYFRESFNLDQRAGSASAAVQ